MLDVARRWVSPDILNSPDSSLRAILSDPNRYVDVVGKTALERYVMLAAAIVGLWDWLTRMDKEISYIWTPGLRTGGTTLYFFIRYGGLAFQAVDCAQLFGIWGAKFCTGYFYFLPVSTALLVYAVDMLLAYRALCLYQLRRALVISTSVLFVLSIIVWAILSAMAYGSFKAVATPQYLTGCWSLLGGFIFASMVPALLFEIWLFVLVVYRVLSWSRDIGWNRKGLVGLLFRDSINWFFIIQAMIIWNTICLGVLPVGLRLLGISPFRVAITICGCRLIVNMRKAAIAQASGPVPEVPPSINRSITAAGTGTEEQPSDSSDHGNAPPGTSAWLHLAQRIGLPPPIQADFRHPWYEPVMTLNKTTHTIDRPHEAPRPVPDQRQRLTWNSRMRPHNLNLSVHGSNGISSLADGSIAFRSMDSTQTSGKPDYLDVDDQVEVSPTAHPKSKSPQSFFEV